MGSLHMVVGPMFSGKTTRLIDIYKQHMNEQKIVCVINHSGDTRYHEHMLSTHSKIMIPCIQLSQLSHFSVSQYDTILINEAQFFSDLKEVVMDYVEKQNKNVYIFGLDGDYTRSRFGSIIDLIPFCNTITKLHATCNICKNDAIFTHRTSKDTQQTIIGTSDYIPLCRSCYKSMNV
jgi:thymidine kinase